MSMVDRIAVRLFWKAEHLDPSSDGGDVPESEWFGDTFPVGLSERRREFWRVLAKESLRTAREPTEKMLDHGRGELTIEDGNMEDAWHAMIDAALGSSDVGRGKGPGYTAPDLRPFLELKP